MRVWTKLASEHGLSGVVPRVWPSFKAFTDKLDPGELQEKLGRIPLTERQERWTKVARGGFGEHDLDAGRKAAALIITRVESQGSATVRGRWASNTPSPTSTSSRSSIALRTSIRTCSTRPQRRR